MRRKLGRSPSPMQRRLNREHASTKEGRMATVGKVARLQVSVKEQKLTLPSGCPISYIPVTSLARGGSSVTINGDVNGRKCIITLDTGATHTIVREDLIGGTVQPADGLKLRMANGDSAKIKGKMIVNIRIGKTLFQHEVLVSDIVDEVILGMDFMRVNGFVLDFGRGVLNSDNAEVPLHFNGLNATVRRITVSHGEELPSKSGTIEEETNKHQVKQTVDKKCWVVRRALRVPSDWRKTRNVKQANGVRFPKVRLKWSRVSQLKKVSSSKMQPTWTAPYRTRKGQGGKRKVVHLERLALYRGGDLGPVRDEQA